MDEIAGRDDDVGQFRRANALTGPRHSAFPSRLRASSLRGQVFLNASRKIEGGFDRVIDPLEPDEANLVACILGHVLYVLTIARRQQPW